MKATLKPEDYDRPASFTPVNEHAIENVPSLRRLSDHAPKTRDAIPLQVRSMTQSGMLPEAISQVLDVSLEDVRNSLNPRNKTENQ